MPMNFGRKWWSLVAMAAAVLLTASCAGAGAIGSGDGRRVLRVAVVSNPQMEDMQDLVGEFEAQHPDVRVRFISLPENQARDKITQSVATGSGQFDVVMVSNYETPIWAANGWLHDLDPRMDATPGYDKDDFIPSIKDSLSYQGHMYAAPFYGETALLNYRKDLFAEAGLTMPENPTWQQVADMAAKLDGGPGGRAGICLRGLPGWGEVMAPLNTMINSFGGRWFDENWNAQLTSPEVREAVNFYVDLVRDHGEPGASSSGFTECLTEFGQGNAAMMFDSTSSAGTLEDPKESTVSGKIGYANAPTGPGGKPASWLYTWALGVPKTTEMPDEAFDFIAWSTSKQYLRTVGERLGWQNLPPGSRQSTYEMPEYEKAAAAFGQQTLHGISRVDQTTPSSQPTPYQGLQFVRIPEFVDLGTRVSQQMSAAIAGSKTADEALEQAQRYADTVGENYRP
uniref:ABC transporter substrate-binding protein n=1 Tax=Saccharopolyspora gregorii TaxID=33914 RepID=UPI0021ACC780|nr:sugar ABC transporter substrate-binding protein [Saccharopolyspora gregorii]